MNPTKLIEMLCDALELINYHTIGNKYGEAPVYISDQGKEELEACIESIHYELAKRRI